MDPMTMAALASAGSGIASSLFGKKKKSSETGPQLIDTRSPEQKAVSSKLSSILLNGGTPYDKARVAGMTDNEAFTGDYMRRALETAGPGINRLLNGEFPEEYFNQAVADPARRDFNTKVAPVMRENSELTGNRFADRSAIEMGTARGEVEAGITQTRGQFGLETYRDPINTMSALSGVLNSAENLFAVPRTIEQAKLDADFEEFMRTNPDAGGLIEAMMQFGNQSPYTAYVPQQQEGIGPSLIGLAGSLAGASMSANGGNLFGTGSQVTSGGYGKSGMSTAQRLAQMNTFKAGQASSTAKALRGY